MRWWVQWVSGSLAAGATLFLVGYAFYKVVPVVAPVIPLQFSNAALYRPWPGWTRTYMAVHPFVYGAVFAAVFLGLRRWSAFAPGVRGGLVYGTGVFVVGSLPVYLLTLASFQVSPEVILSWILQSLAQYALAGMILGCVCDGASVRVSAILPAPASRVWKLLLLKSTFLYVTRGMMSAEKRPYCGARGGDHHPATKAQGLLLAIQGRKLGSTQAPCPAANPGWWSSPPAIQGARLAASLSHSCGHAWPAARAPGAT